MSLVKRKFSHTNTTLCTYMTVVLIDLNKTHKWLQADTQSRSCRHINTHPHCGSGMRTAKVVMPTILLPISAWHTGITYTVHRSHQHYKAADIVFSIKLRKQTFKKRSCCLYLSRFPCTGAFTAHLPPCPHILINVCFSSVASSFIHHQTDLIQIMKTVHWKMACVSKTLTDFCSNLSRDSTKLLMMEGHHNVAWEANVSWEKTNKQTN